MKLSYRTCDDWKCLGRCDMYLTLESEIQDYTVTDEIDLVSILSSKQCKK